MLDVLWTPLIVFSLWIYIALNIFRYKFFEYKDEEKSCILFVIFRVIVLAIIITYLFSTFNEYVFYCQMKLFWYFFALIGITLCEFIYSLSIGEDFYNFLLMFSSLIMAYIAIISISLIITLNILDFYVNRQAIDSSVKKYEIIPRNKENDKNLENENTFFGILGYEENGKYYYSYYYLSEDTKEMIRETIDESDLDGNIKVLDEGEQPYIESIKEGYINREEIDKKTHDGEVKYKIYAPLSEFHGEYSSNSSLKNDN